MADEIDLQWFAAEDEGRTEEASEYKLEKARKEGRLAKSQEVSSALVFLFCVITLIILSRFMLNDFSNILRYYFERSATVNIRDSNLARAFFVFFLRLFLPIALVGVIGGILGNIIQNRGFIFSLKPITPNFRKIVPNFAQYFQNTLFSIRGVFNVAKSIGKVSVLAIIAFFLIRRDVPILIQEVQNGNIKMALFVVSTMAATILIIASVIFLLISIPDYIVQRYQFRQEMKMTKQEVKEEYKELEGDVQQKRRLEQEQRRIMQANIPKNVKEADVVITNPTHFAVALKYETTAPKVTAKGEDNTAFLIKRLAKENEVPIVENRPLARSLFTDVEVGDIIPEEYYRAVSVVYAHIKYKLKK